MSSRRPDFRECLATTDNSVTINRRNNSWNVVTLMNETTVITRRREINNTTRDTNHATTGHHHNHPTHTQAHQQHHHPPRYYYHYYYDLKNLLREINTPTRRLNKRFNFMRLEALVRTNPSTIMYDDIIVRNCYREKFDLRKFLPPRWLKSQQQQDDHHHHGNSNSSNKSDNGSSFLPFYVMFGVLGMFRKPSASELEEERVRLTDEQKMKKMKPVELAIAKGVLSMCDQNYDKANQLFHEALHMAQDENDEEQEELILNLIASNYFESGDFHNAEKLFIDLMKRMIARDVAPTSPAILELSLKLASIYSKSPETAEKALKGFKFVISSLLNSLDDIVSNIEELDFQEISDEKKNELALLGWSYDWFAKHLLTMNDYSAAAIMLHKAYEISSKVLGPFHDQTLILLNDIGTTLAMNDSPDEGRKFMKKAVEGAITNNSSELASFYVNLGLVYLKLRDLKEAKQYCEYSMDLAKKNPEQYNSHDVVELSRTCLTHIERLLGTER